MPDGLEDRHEVLGEGLQLLGRLGDLDDHLDGVAVRERLGTAAGRTDWLARLPLVVRALDGGPRFVSSCGRNTTLTGMGCAP